MRGIIRLNVTVKLDVGMTILAIVELIRVFH